MNEAKRIIHEWFERVWNQGDEAAIHQLMAPGARYHGLRAEEENPIPGPAGFLPFFRSFRAAFPDIHVEILRTVAETDLVAIHCRVTGTRAAAPPGEVPGARVCFEGMVFATVRQGQIDEGWNCFDFLAMNAQLAAAGSA
jgi:predicted ester cyclase